MQLFRTVCSTDFKSRPTHHLYLVGETNEVDQQPLDRIKILKDLMDKDVREWQAGDVAVDEYDGSDDSWIDKRASELVDDPGLSANWENEDRFEMQTDDSDYRAFVNRCDDDLTTIVYHFFGD